MLFIVSVVVGGVVTIAIATIGVHRGFTSSRGEREYDRDRPDLSPKYPSKGHKDDLTSEQIMEIRGYDGSNGWAIDQVMLQNLMKQNPNYVENVLKGIQLLNMKVKKSGLENTLGKYSSTFTTGYWGKHPVTPRQAIDLFYKEYKQNGMSFKALYILGGAFVAGSEAARGASKMGLNKSLNLKMNENPWGDERYQLSTVQGRSFPMLSLGMFWTKPKKWPHIMDSALSSFRYDRPHGRCKEGTMHILAPTTKFGSSKTIIKIVSTCQMLGMEREEAMSVVFAVLYHWIQKQHAGRMDRHSLLEGLQGSLMAIGMKRYTIIQ